MNDAEADRILAALSGEGFALPYMARSRNYETADELRAADAEAWAENRAALRRALLGDAQATHDPSPPLGVSAETAGQERLP